MLERVLEPEVMDTVEEAADYDSMDHSAVNRIFVDDLLAAGNLSGDLLDLGTGTAQIPITLCQSADGFRVSAVDLASSMLDLARYNVELAELNDRIRLDRIDAKQLPFPDQCFDAVISNSIIHHIPEPLNCLREAVRVTKLNGHLFFRDLLRPSTQQELEQLVQTYAGDENEHQQKMLAESLHAALSLDEMQQFVGSLGFETATVTATSDRHWTWSAIRA